MARSAWVRLSSGICLAGAAALLVSLPLTWSHQISPAVRSQVGAAALVGVPADASALQVYAICGEVLAVLALAIAAAALWGRRRDRLILLAAVLVAVAFTAHALASPPTNGLLIATGPTRYLTPRARPGVGEVVALAGLIAGGVGLVAGAVRRRPRAAPPTSP